MSGKGVSFVSESVIEENRRKRQEEWDKVRTEDQPLECPEEEHDTRTLFERLQQQKDKKEEEFAEQHRMRNMVKGLDTEEADFLNHVDRQKSTLEQQRKNEENEVLEEYRNAMQEQMLAAAKAQSKPPEKTLSSLPSDSSKSKMSHRALLASVVKRKSTDGEEADASKRSRQAPGGSSEQIATASALDKSVEEADTADAPAAVPAATTMQCIAHLPGIGQYQTSSDEESGSSSDVDDHSLTDIISIISKRSRVVAANHNH
ncbi:PREDICTED: protein FAM192A-like [Priapulus caudatus]|uniref:Protein FAM192A-like n=1 Tax=Priapulus caudatus TaxID=37621 RepID=A0ABM1EEW4_PRICU|nr:PREDICTED: protein FAM192A-like [Priapulus caudatus]XP_014670736.1 PREDICTED: protein FAM192A-like [Priapulus caudatus]